MRHLAGLYIPSCDEDGYYRKVQCDQSRGECWCVDLHGEEMMGSRIHGNPDCGMGRGILEVSHFSQQRSVHRKLSFTQPPESRVVKMFVCASIIPQCPHMLYYSRGSISPNYKSFAETDFYLNASGSSILSTFADLFLKILFNVLGLN